LQSSREHNDSSIGRSAARLLLVMHPDRRGLPTLSVVPQCLERQLVQPWPPGLGRGRSNRRSKYTRVRSSRDSTKSGISDCLRRLYGSRLRGQPAEDESNWSFSISIPLDDVIAVYSFPFRSGEPNHLLLQRAAVLVVPGAEVHAGFRTAVKSLESGDVRGRS
jgi:hypothetical protein